MNSEGYFIGVMGMTTAFAGGYFDNWWFTGTGFFLMFVSACLLIVTLGEKLDK